MPGTARHFNGTEAPLPPTPTPQLRPHPDSTFSLRPGVRLEPLGDGSAVLFASDLDLSLTVNHTAALLCSYADGQYTLAMVVQEMRQVFPGSVIDEESLAACLLDLQARSFLQWG
jgi:hypothetical protein